MNISLKIIGQNIKRFRKASGLTQEQTAEQIGISLIHYGRIERGERQPSIKQLASIAAVFHTSIEALLQGCCMDKVNHAAVFNAAKDAPLGTAEYALLLLDAYREQIQDYLQVLKQKENALR